MKQWILAIAFAVLGSGIYLLFATRDAAPAPAEPIAPPAPAPPPSSVGDRAPVAMPRPPRPAPPRAVDDEPADGPATEDPAPADAVLTTQEVRDHVEASFAAAAPAASSDLGQGLDRGVRAALSAGSSVRSVECRGSLCRVETVHPDVDDFRDFMRRAFQDSTRIANGPAFVSLVDEPEPGQPVVAVAYVGREGSRLPMPAAVDDRR